MRKKEERRRRGGGGGGGCVYWRGTELLNLSKLVYIKVIFPFRD